MEKEEIDGLQSESSVGSRDVLQVVVVVSVFFFWCCYEECGQVVPNRDPNPPSLHPPAPQELLPEAAASSRGPATSPAIRKVVQVSAPNVT